MEFCDLNLANPALEKRALELGFSRARPAAVFAVNSRPALRALRNSNSGTVAVEGSSGDLLKDCIRECRDKILLINPHSVPRYFLDDGLVRSVASAAPSQRVAFEIQLRPLLLSSFAQRAKIISQTSEFLRRCLKLGAPFVLTSRASSEWELKSPREVIAIGTLFGLNHGQAGMAVGRTPGILS
ncbi:hypothetical protein HY995_04120 [Candidatus Micrarchaeota archaeon]|nr:hypothetical protein [Candidatus Micrarchaeota archaeon]